MQNHYNSIWREDERELLPFCRAEGLGVISYSPMARGFLTGAGRCNGMAPLSGFAAMTMRRKSTAGATMRSSQKRWTPSQRAAILRPPKSHWPGHYRDQE